MKFGKLLLTAAVGSLLFLNFGYGAEAKYTKEQLAEIEKAKTFLKESDFNYPTKKMVKMACIAGDLEALNLMKKNGCRWFKEPEALFAAAEYGRLECCKFLIREGADVNAKNEKGMTALHWAALSVSVELCKYLVSKGADVNAKDGLLGWTVLHSGAASGSVELCKYLISQGADVNAKDNYGRTVLHLAARSGSVEMCKYLVSKGANVNAKDKYGRTVLHAGASSGSVEVCKYLVSQGVDVNAKYKYGKTALDYAKTDKVRQYLISQGAKKGSELR